MNRAGPLCQVATFVTVALAGALASASTEADLDALREKLQARYPTAGIVDVRPGPFPQLYEVFAGTQLVYTDASGEFLIMGPIYETASKRDVTIEKFAERSRIDFRSLPFDQAIKIVNGKGTRQLAVFSDPFCPYCQELEKTLAFIPDLTVYIFPFPLEQLHPGATARARDIWCSKDRAKAWREALTSNVAPEPRRDCKGDPLAQLQELGKKLYINSTPTLYDAAGRKIMGAPTTEQLEAMLKVGNTP